MLKTFFMIVCALMACDIWLRSDDFISLWFASILTGATFILAAAHFGQGKGS